MKRITRSLLVFALALAIATAQAADPKGKKAEAKTEPKSMSLTGEIVDMGCYMAEGAKGEAHKSCASMCISSGMPMGLLTGDGKLYLLTLNHDKADPYNSAKKMAAEQVTVTGMMSERNGMKSLSVDDVKELNPAKPE
jgi:hypothetical protein